MKSKVYIETSIVSYYVARPSRDLVTAARQQVTREWWEIAIAAINGMDFLLTWNLAHINNAIMKREITKICEGRGYECPIICSPEELVGEES